MTHDKVVAEHVGFTEGKPKQKTTAVHTPRTHDTFQDYIGSFVRQYYSAVSGDAEPDLEAFSQSLERIGSRYTPPPTKKHTSFEVVLGTVSLGVPGKEWGVEVELRPSYQNAIARIRESILGKAETENNKGTWTYWPLDKYMKSLEYQQLYDFVPALFEEAALQSLFRDTVRGANNGNKYTFLTPSIRTTKNLSSLVGVVPQVLITNYALTLAGNVIEVNSDDRKIYLDLASVKFSDYRRHRIFDSVREFRYDGSKLRKATVFAYKLNELIKQASS